ncbi:MAG: ATP-binding protein [Calditerrivibrio sp.]|nr:ATP-binding protein [Calditerrivibrio sp.]
MLDIFLSIFDISETDKDYANLLHKLSIKYGKKISTQFYDFLMRNGYTKNFLRGESEILRLSKTQMQYQRNLFSLDFYDLIPYIYNVGLIHYRIRLDNTYVVAAHSLLKNLYTEIIFEEKYSNVKEILKVLEKYLGLSLAIMLHSYYERSDLCLFSVNEFKSIVDIINNIKRSHITNYDNIRGMIEKDDLSQDIVEVIKDPKKCYVSEILERHRHALDRITVDMVEEISAYHSTYHVAVSDLLINYLNKNIVKEDTLQRINFLTKEFLSYLDSIVDMMISHEKNTIILEIMLIIEKIININFKRDFPEIIIEFQNIIKENSNLINELILSDHEETGFDISMKFFVNNRYYYLNANLCVKNKKFLQESVLKIYINLFQELFNIHIQEIKYLEMAQQLLESEKIKNIFLASVTHEIRTPLNAILGFAQLLKKMRNVDETTVKYAEKIIEAGGKLLDYVNKIIDFSKLQTNKLALNKKDNKVLTIVNRVISILSSLLSEKKIKLEIDIDPNLTVYADEKLLEDVVFNILGNAIKFVGHEGHIVIRGYEDTAMREMVISIADDGIGFDPKNKDKIFEPFFQEARGDNPIVKGSGLGLSIVKSIIENHGGRVWAESELGKGATFYFTIPLLNKKS